MLNYISLLSSVNNHPLKYWSAQQSLTGSIRLVLDQHLMQNVVEIRNRGTTTNDKTSVVCPAETDQILNIQLPFLVLIIKNSDSYCLIKLQIIDKNKNRYYLYLYNDKCDKRRVIKVPNSQIVEVNYEREWNKLELNLPKMIWQSFQANYDSLQRIQISGNCRLRRVYCIDKHYSDFEVSTKLCQNFFDYYMTKWGNKKIERFTQTDKNKCTTSNNSDNTSIVYLNADDLNKKTNPYFIVPEYNKLKKIETNFSKLLRASCRHTIDNFFNISTKSACCLKNPKIESLTTSGVEKQKIILATIKFINDMQSTHFAFVKEPFMIHDETKTKTKTK